MRGISVLTVTMVWMLVGSAFTPVWAQDPDYVLQVTDSAGLLDDTAPVDFGLMNNGDPIESFEWGACHDDIIAVDTVAAGLSLDDLEVSVESIELLDEGWTVSVVLDADNDSTLDSGEYPFLYDVDYLLTSIGDATIEFCTLDGVSPSVSTAEETIVPETDVAVVEVDDPATTLCVAPASCLDCGMFFTIENSYGEFVSNSGQGYLTVELAIEEDPDNDEYPTSFGGFQLALEHDDTLLIPDSVRMLDPVAALNDGDGPDFVQSCLDLPLDSGAIVGVVFAILGGQVLQFQEPTTVAEFRYVTVPDSFIEEDEDVETELKWIDTMSCNGSSATVANVGSTCRGISYRAEGTDATVALLVQFPPDFIRGDCDGDGAAFPLIDTIYLLEFGFVNGPALPCPDAGDVDGDDVLFPLIDGLYFLNWGFTNGPEPAAPGPDDCGPDPMPGGPGCETPPDICD